MPHRQCVQFHIKGCTPKKLARFQRLYYTAGRGDPLSSATVKPVQVRFLRVRSTQEGVRRVEVLKSWSKDVKKHKTTMVIPFHDLHLPETRMPEAEAIMIASAAALRCGGKEAAFR
jgi:hypothetical protein